MKQMSTGKELLPLLVKMYNQSIQNYYYFPEVIICGQHRIEKTDFERLLSEGFLTAYHTDSFGKLYHLSAKAEQFLRDQTHKRKQKTHQVLAAEQVTLFA